MFFPARCKVALVLVGALALSGCEKMKAGVTPAADRITKAFPVSDEVAVAVAGLLETAAGNGNPAASKDILDILKVQQDNSGIRRHTPDDIRVANKSGALDALRSDVGIVYTQNGPIALAITIDDMPETDYSRDNPGERLIWQLTSALLDGLSAR